MSGGAVEVAPLSESDAPAWETYLAAHPRATFYHQLAWRDLIASSYGWRTHYLTARREGRLVGLLPLVEMGTLGAGRVLVSLPFSNYGGVLSDDPDAASALVAAAGRILEQRGLDYLELKQLDQIRAPGLVSKLHYHSFLLDLQGDPDRLWNEALRSSARTQTRKAMRAGLVARVGLDQLRAVYEVYARRMRDLGTPSHGWGWFLALRERFAERLVAVAVYLGETALSAGLVLVLKETALFQHAGSLPEARRYSANNLTYWTAIKESSERGLRVFDFARTRVGQGTWHFKTQWGARPVQTYYQYLLHRAREVPDLDPHNPSYRAFIALWKRLPLPLARALGPHLRARITT